MKLMNAVPAPHPNINNETETFWLIYLFIYFLLKKNNNKNNTFLVGTIQVPKRSKWSDFTIIVGTLGPQ